MIYMGPRWGRLYSNCVTCAKGLSQTSQVLTFSFVFSASLCFHLLDIFSNSQFTQPSDSHVTELCEQVAVEWFVVTPPPNTCFLFQVDFFKVTFSQPQSSSSICFAFEFPLLFLIPAFCPRHYMTLHTHVPNNTIHCLQSFPIIDRGRAPLTIPSEMYSTLSESDPLTCLKSVWRHNQIIRRIFRPM